MNFTKEVGSRIAQHLDLAMNAANENPLDEDGSVSLFASQSTIKELWLAENQMERFAPTSLKTAKDDLTKARALLRTVKKGGQYRQLLAEITHHTFEQITDATSPPRPALGK